MKKLIIPMICLLFLTGCWNYQDTNRRLIVAGASIDLGDNGETLVTAEIITFSKNESGSESQLLSGNGNSVSDAFNDILKKSGKELYWRHASVLVLGADYARNGTRELLDYILNDQEMRLTLDFAVSGMERGSDVFELDTGDQKIKSNAITSLLYEGEKLGFCKRELAYSAINIYSEGLRDFVMPVIKEGEDSIMEASGCAAFSGDRMVGTIDSTESQYIHMLDGTLKSMELQIDTDSIKSSINLAKPSIKTKLYAENGKAEAEIKMKCDFEVVMSIEDPPMERGERMETIKSILEKQLKEGIEKTNRHFELLGCDLFGWGEQIYRHYPQEYKKMYGNGGSDVKTQINFEAELHSRIEGIPGPTANQEGG